MKLTTADTKTTRTKTGTITVADIRKKFRIPDDATLAIPEDYDGPIAETSPVLIVTHVVEASK
jgi:hypothetical protein